MKKYILLSIVLGHFASMFAQHILSGKVTTQAGEPLPGATIYCYELSKGTFSDSDGNFELSNLPAGKITVQFSFVGYASQVQIVLMDENVKRIDVALHETALEAEEVVVSGGYNATQHQTAVKIDVLNLDEKRRKISPNIMETLSQVPGVSMISKGSGVAKPVIRGLSMNDILTLNNGVRIENYQYSDHHPLGVNEFGIEDVEIIKGPASLLYGSDAIGGVINFIREKPAPVGTLQGDYGLQLFSNSLGVVQNLGLKGASKDIFGGLRVGYVSHADYLQGGGDFVPNTRFNESSLKANIGHAGRMGTFELFYDHNRHNIGLVEEESAEEIDERGRNPDIFYQRLDNQMLSSRNRLYFNRYKLQINAAYQDNKLSHIGEANEYEVEMRLRTLTYETKLHFPSDLYTEYILGFQGMNQWNDNLNDRATKLLPDAVMQNYSLFGLLQRTFFSKLKVQGGIRYDYRSVSTQAVGDPAVVDLFRPALDKSYDSFSGSIGATLDLNESLLFRSNIAAAYRTPNLAELTSKGKHEERFEIGDASLRPQNAYEVDASLHLHKENYTLDLAGFYNSIRDYIFLSPTGDESAGGVPIYQYRQGDAYLYGGEFAFHIHPVNLSWLHFQTDFSSVIGKQRNGDYLPFIPAHQLNAEIRAEKNEMAFFQDAFISISTNTAFAQRNPAPNETGTSGYTIVDATIGAVVKVARMPVSWQLGVNNLFDVRYVDHLSTLKEVEYYNPGRNVVLSMKLRF
jgi:iron complex outermembrane receptor protein